MAAVDQHISYVQELHAGAVVSVRTRVLEVKDRSLRFEHEMVDDYTGAVAARTTLKVVHLDTAQRKVIAVDFLTQSECNGGIASTEWDTQNHGSHVAGTIAGDNFATLIGHDAGDGMAPGAKLVVQDAGFLTDNCGDLPGIGCPVVDLTPIFQQAYTQGARIHTNSWGDNENAAMQNNYTAASQDVDDFMFTHPDFLILFAAGNSGPGTGSVGSPSTAKNGISVGATLRGTSANSMASFSSCGPTTDGRIKPDVVVFNAVI
jgi:subtilisin family serine protease